MEVWGAVDNERSVLTDDLSRLNERQWDVQSLCTEWKIRHVVAHLVIEANVKLGATLVGVVKNGMNVNRALAQAALTAGIAPPDVLLLRFKSTIGSRTILPFTKSACVLADVICHAADIRRPLGLSRDVPKSALPPRIFFDPIRSQAPRGALLGCASLPPTRTGYSGTVRTWRVQWRRSSWPWLVEPMRWANWRETDSPRSKPAPS
jgi:hypothetical protein